MEGMLSPADVAVLSGNNRNNDGFGDGNGAWWIIIFLLFAWGRNGFGGYGGGSGSGADANYVLNSDFATLQRIISDGFNSIERRTDGIVNGICDLGYNQLNLSNGINQNVSNGFYNTLNAITTNGYDTRIAVNGVQNALQSCCCDIRYENAQNTCAISNAINNGIRDVMTNCNNNYKQLHEELVNYRIQDKDQQIQALQTQLNNAELRASQEAQSNYLYTAITDKLSPCPRPAYLTCNPNAPYNYQVVSNGCGCGNY